MLYSIDIHWGHGNADYYAVMANSKEQAKERLESALQKDNDSLKHCHSIDIREADEENGTVVYITERSG